MTKQEANVRFLEVMQEAMPYFQVLSDTERQQIVVMLSETDSMNVTSIVNRLELSRTAVSYHLKLLRQSGLIDFEKKGCEMNYFLTIKKPFHLLRELTDIIENHCTIK